MAPTFSVCTNGSCASQGAGSLLLDLEELCGSSAQVCPTGCFGRCGHGPNLEVENSGTTKIVEGVKSFKKMERLVKEHVDGVVISDLQKQVGKMKFEARRQEDVESRKKMIADAFQVLEQDGAAKGLNGAMIPQLRSELLVMQSRELMKKEPDAAVAAAEEACTLKPGWAHAKLALSGALEATGLFTDALAALKEAMESGGSLDKNALKRQMTRLERKAATEVKAPAAVAKPSAKDAADAKAPTAAAKPSSGAAKSAAAPARTADEAEALAKAALKRAMRQHSSAKDSAADARQTPATQEVAIEAQREAEQTQQEATDQEVPEFLEWSLEEILRLNHDCIEVRLRFRDVALVARQCAGHGLADDSWHVDLLAEIGDSYEEVRRSYTPVSMGGDYLNGKLVLMLKIYPQGKMTRHLASLRPGAAVLVSAPHATVESHSFTHGVLMIAGGSAVTVAIQVCSSVLRRLDAIGKTGGPGSSLLVLCNKSAEDIVYQQNLEELQRTFPALHILHCLSHGSLPCGSSLASWWRGRICWEALDPHLKGRRPEAVLSGPPGLLRTSLDMLVGHGWSEKHVYTLDELAPPASVALPATLPEAQALVQVPQKNGVRRRGGPGDDEPLLHFPMAGEKPQKVESTAATALLAAPSRALWGAVGSMLLCTPVCRRRCGKSLDEDIDDECEVTRIA